MRKNLLLSLFLFVATLANAQWTKVNVPHDDLSLWYDVEVPNEKSVWASEWVSLDGGASFSYTNKFIRTANAGNSWKYGEVQAPAGYAISSLHPIDADTCYAAMYNGSAGIGGGIFKTTDAGVSWTQLGAGTLFNANSFPDFVYFWNPKKGIAMGDGNGPGDPYLEIYTTNDYGATWTRVPRANLPPTQDVPIGITNSYYVSGKRIWMYVYEGTTSSQFIYRSDDKGLHWNAYPLNMPTTVQDFAFTDELNGVAIGIDAQVPYLYRTADGGETWDGPVSYSGPLMGGFITAVPGTSMLVSTNAVNYGPTGSSFSRDLGNTWVALDRSTTNLHSDVNFFNKHVGWSGQFRLASTQRGGMYKWADSVPLVSGLVTVNSDAMIAQLTGSQSLRLYPNPVKNVLHVDGLNSVAATTISIVNNAGKTVQKITTTASGYTLNVQALPAGSYYLLLESGKKITTLKFVK